MEESSRMGVNINIHKTKTQDMIRVNVTVDEQPIQQTDTFGYFETIIDKDTNTTTEVKTIIE